MGSSNKGKNKKKAKSKAPAADSSAEGETKKVDTKKWVLLISIASIVVAVIAVLAVVLPRDDSKDSSDSQSLAEDSKLDEPVIQDNLFDHERSEAPTGGELSLDETIPSSVPSDSSSSSRPSELPSSVPSIYPSSYPSTVSPSVSPSSSPTTKSPTRQPSTTSPSDNPTTIPSDTPTSAPTHIITEFGRDYQVILELPHDTSSFTQGLFTYDGILYEGTGQRGESVLRKFAADNVTVVKETSLDDRYFGEGISIYPDPNENGRLKIIQLTWTRDTAFVYDFETLELLDTFSYETTTSQGWGITYNSNTQEFYVSDGSEYIHVWNLQLEQVRRFPVSFQLTPETPIRSAKQLNELEYDHYTDTLLANKWMEDVLLRINVTTGETIHVYDFSQLYVNRENTDIDAVFNGVALTQVPGQIWVTGKYWPTLYLVELLR